MREEILYKNLNFSIYNDREHFISSRLKLGETWENKQIDYIINNIANKSKNMIDVGGDIGTYSIILSQYFKKIYCFEPNQDNFDMINHNLSRNNIKNVFTLNVACSDEDGKCSMITNHKNQIDKSKDGLIDVVVLDNIIKDRIDFIKIDVEGHEYSVLRGAKNIIKTHHPDIYLETHPTIIQDSKENSEKFLKDMGYVEVEIFSDYDKFWRKI